MGKIGKEVWPGKFTGKVYREDRQGVLADGVAGAGTVGRRLGGKASRGTNEKPPGVAGGSSLGEIQLWGFWWRLLALQGGFRGVGGGKRGLGVEWGGFLGALAVAFSLPIPLRFRWLRLRLPRLTEPRQPAYCRFARFLPSLRFPSH